MNVKKPGCEQKVIADFEKCKRIELIEKKTVCWECLPGYTLDLDQKCVSCQKSNCAYCNLNQECHACFEGKVMAENECSESKKCPDVNCVICGGLSQNKCLVCNERFALTEKGTCVENANNCEYLDTSEGCLRCSVDYYISYNGSCRSSKSSPRLAIYIWLLTGLAFGAIVFYSYRSWANQYKPNEGYTTV